MGIFQQFPYTNFHEMNLDQIIKIMREMQDEWLATKAEWASYKDFITNYFKNLDVSEEVLAAMRTMAASGKLNPVIDPVIAEITTQWLIDNITITEGKTVIDKTLSIEEAAADAKAAGDAINYNAANLYKNKIAGVLSKNLLDKTGKHTLITNGYYRNYQNGKLEALANWCVSNIYIKENTSCTVNIANAHVCFFSDYSALNFIGGHLVNATNGYNFNIPANTVLMTVSIPTDTLPDAQVEYGILRSPFENFNFIDIADIYKNKITGVYGKNLFDKTGEHTPIINNYYRGYADGNWNSLANWSVALFKVQPNQQFTINNNNTHVCYYSDEYASVYIGGFLTNDTNGHTFTTPEAAVTMSLSIQTDRFDVIQLELGDTETSYEAFKFGIKNSDIIGASTIFQVGSGRYYSTIQSAIDAASDGDIIYIDPGTYYEAINMVNKNLHLIGSGRDNTIIKYAGDDYLYPPLEASKGIIESLSFITTAVEPAPETLGTSYCVHIDYDSEADSALQFINCYFENPAKHCVGIGLRENFKLNFTNCKFKSGIAPVYCHEQQANNKTGQRIELINCSIQTTGTDSCIRLQESRAYTGNEMIILMQRCIVKTNGSNVIVGVTYPDSLPPTGSHYLNLTGWYLDSMSALNNAEILNA